MAQFRCKYFKIKELVHPSFLGTSESILWGLLDERLLRMLDAIREKYGPCTINANGLTDCGLRKMGSSTGASFSAHKFGRAMDVHIRDIELAAAQITNDTARKNYKVREYNRVRNELMADSKFSVLNFENTASGYPNGITWLHIDVVNRANRLFAA